MSEPLSRFDDLLNRAGEKPALADGSMKFALVASRFNAEVVNRLIEGAVATLESRGADRGNIALLRVPGAFELPTAARQLLQQNRYAAIIALGCVIRGETPHFEYVSSECARGLAEVAREAPVPVVFGVLTTDTQEQADQRSALLADWANPEQGHSESCSNKGSEAAVAALEMKQFMDVAGGGKFSA